MPRLRVELCSLGSGRGRLGGQIDLPSGAPLATATLDVSGTATPVEDRPAVPSGLGTVFVGFGLYSLIVNLLVGPDVGGWFFPTPQWWVLMLWVVPPFLGLTLALVLRLSARVKSTAAAQQASGLISLPMIMIAYSQSTGALWTGSIVSWVTGAVAWVGAFVALSRGIRSVTRARLLGVADER